MSETAAYQPTLLGVVNLSPESMVKDSIAPGPDAALLRAKALREHGVTALDVGGRSITPDAPPIGDAEEQARLAPVVPHLVREGFRVSVDTWSAETAERALGWGANIVNYTRTELPDRLLAAIAEAGAALAITYMPYGDAYRMRDAERLPYRVDGIVEFLAPRVERARAAGIGEIVVDPNLGILHPDTDDYTKAHLQLEVLEKIERVRALGCPLLLYARAQARAARAHPVRGIRAARAARVRAHARARDRAAAPRRRTRDSRGDARMSAPLEGRRALVTGAAKRTGRDLALALARAGADVAVHYRSSGDQAREVVREIEALGRRAVAVGADLLDAAQAERAVAEAERSLGGVDVLINNVGAIVWKDIGELSPDEWRTGLEGTVTVTFHACRAVLPGMRRRGHGRIVNIVDADADLLAPVVHATSYKIGKTGVWILTKTLAVSEGPHGITVNAISPGTLDNSEKQPPLSRIPVGRVGTTGDLASALLYLCSAEASYVTGVNLKVSGGYLI